MLVTDIIIGQEAICRDGLGRVSEVRPCVTDSRRAGSVRVQTYIKDRGCCWDIDNVELIDPRGAQ